MPIGGTNKARVVPWAVFWERPEIMIKAGTMMVPPPMPINPLKKPDTIPSAIYNEANDMLTFIPSFSSGLFGFNYTKERSQENAPETLLIVQNH